MSPHEHWSIAPYFIVDDVVASADFYRDRLGFRYDRFWGDPPRFCMVQRGGIVIMLSQLDEPRGSFPNHGVDPERGAWDAYVWVEDAEADPVPDAHLPLVEAMRHRWVIGTPSSAAEDIRSLAATYDVDEVMLHPVAGAFQGTPVDASPARELTLELLAKELL